MIANQMRTNQLGLAATAWYLDFLDAIEAKDIGRIADYLADGFDMRVNNAPSIEGKAAVVEQLRAQWQRYKSVTHEVLNILDSDTGFVSESLHHCDKLDGTQITTRTAVFTERSADGFVASIRIFNDILTTLINLPCSQTAGREFGGSE